MLWVVNGRLAGISTIAGNALHGEPRRHDCGGSSSSPGCRSAPGSASSSGRACSAEIPATLPTIGLGPLGLISAGLLVGIGTRLANGCTSGHGICGLSRLSLRSFVAVGTFMASAIVTVFIVRHVVG